ncbi:cytochrome c oxidase subunit II [Halorussus gelatinilyticus]|uniref:cytochrome-c oxidase n=1 Tax=Halorussus gelatinilyticus TaxID=2937524 RepID=A0A8U0IFN5_9EURY|nr:cytochrome c oxidase subunit II [Halorussus gelatinilyticus]UPV99510.1 cytochrome c oxidase subunit II [Halorussus gelatinilyticus]
MRQKRTAFATLLGVAALALFADPALAQGYDSTTESLIRSLNTQLMYMAIPITVLVEGILIYTVWKYRKNDDPKPTKENRRLEISWTIATALVLLVVGYASYGVMANEYVSNASGEYQPSEQAVEVEVVGQKYLWNFNYQGENVSTTGTLVLPKGQNVFLHITSTDWLHAFHVPELGLKQDAIPGQTETIKTKITNTGTYQLYCAEYCGVGHSKMLGEVEVVSQQEYQQWLDQQQGNSTAS